MKSLRTNVSQAAVIAIVLFCLSSIGCENSVVEAVPRKASNEPVLATEIIKPPLKSLNQLDLTFIHEDHFACFTIDMTSLLANPELADVPWDSLQQQLASVVGDKNSEIGNVRRVWVLLDRDGLSFDNGDQQLSPLVYVIDLVEIKDEDQLTEQQVNDAGESPPMRVAKISESRLVIGSPGMVEKISNTAQESTLGRLLSQMELNSDVEGVVDIRPIRSTLRSMFEMVGSFGGESFAKFTRLPDVLQRIEVHLDLDSLDMLQATAFIDDEEMTKELALLANENGQSDSTPFSNGGLPFGLGGGNGMGSMGQMPKTMIKPTSTELLAEVGQEITEDGLLVIEGKNRELTITLRRPTRLNDLIAASIEDARRQLTVVQRAEKLQRIASAFKAYSEEHETLPPAGVVVDATNIPPQFNWRIGLLPFLDQQELYDQFDFSKAWDSPENLAVAQQIPDVFSILDMDKSDETKVAKATMTRWRVAGGALGIYQSSAPKLDDISDRKIWTALVVESSRELAVPWTKPGAWEIDEVKLDDFGSPNEQGILFINAAFETRIVIKELDKLRGVLTPAGEESFKRLDFIPTGLER